MLPMDLEHCIKNANIHSMLAVFASGCGLSVVSCYMRKSFMPTDFSLWVGVR
jgi:hypothetical protein